MTEFLEKCDLTKEIRINYKNTNLLYSDINNNDSHPIINHKTISTADFFNILEFNTNKNDSNKHILTPPNCRFMESFNCGEETMFVIEEPPAFRTINVELNLSIQYETAKRKYPDIDNYFSKNNNIYKFKLAFPYMIFVFLIGKDYTTKFCKLFCTKSNLIGMGDTLFIAPLSNISSSQTVCFGYGSKDSRHSYMRTINERIASFWFTSFNNDYRENLLNYENIPFIQNFFEWAYMSENNPMFIYNIEWIPYKTLGSVIDYIRDDRLYRSNEKKLNFLNTVSDIEKNQIPVKMHESILPKKTIDIAGSYYVRDLDYSINIGDSFTNQKTNKKFFIESLLSTEGDYDLKYIFISDENNNKYLLKTRSNCLTFLRSKLIESFTEYQLTDDLKIKIGDLLIINNGYTTYYKEVSSIRTSRGFENEVEIKLGKEYYFASYLKTLNIKLFDTENILFYDKKLIKEKEYIIVTEYGQSQPIYTYIKGVFKEFSVVSNDVSARFEDEDGHIITIRQQQYYNNNNKKQVLDITEVEKLPPTFLYYNKLLYNSVDCYKNNNMLLVNNSDRTISLDRLKTTTKYDYIKDILNKDKTEVNIKGLQFDLTYKVGETVITGSIYDLFELQKIKIISGFVQDNNNDLYILLQDASNSNSVVEKFKLIDNNSKHVNLLSIRKVTTGYGPIVIGDKIIAKDKGIANFPKKDCNQIISIITDSPFEPLVLCSNGCTLWLSTIEEKFEIIKQSDPKWSNLKICTETKISLQNGDIVRDSFGYTKILLSCGGSKTTKSMYLQNYIKPLYYNADIYYYLKPVSKNDEIIGIPLPRIVKSKDSEIEKLNGFMDLFGYIHERDIPFTFNDTEPK